MEIKVALSNAEKQAAFRARRDSRIKELEAEVEQLRNRSTPATAFDGDEKVLIHGLDQLESEHIIAWWLKASDDDRKFLICSFDEEAQDRGTSIIHYVPDDTYYEELTLIVDENWEDRAEEEGWVKTNLRSRIHGGDPETSIKQKLKVVKDFPRWLELASYPAIGWLEYELRADIERWENEMNEVPA